MSIQLAYTEQGEGFPLFLLHGNGEDSRIFQNHMERFSRIRRVIAIDTRGHGQSPRGEAPFTLDQFAKDLLGFMDTHQIEQADILGFSDGGNIALLFALAHPGRVRQMIVCGANLNPAGMNAIALLLISVFYALSWFAALFMKQARHWNELLRLMACEPQIKPRELSALAMPTLVIAGTHDLIRRRHTRKIASMLPNSTLCLMQGGHMLVTQKPDAFGTAVVTFLTGEHTQV